MTRKIFIVCLFSAVWIVFSAQGLFPAEEKVSGKSAAEIIEKNMRKEGLQGARRVFAEMRQAPEGTYSFVENEFIKLADRLIKEKKIGEAIEILIMCLPVFPDSPRLLFGLALAYKENGDEESFYRYVRKTHLARQKLYLQGFLNNNQGKLISTADAVIQKHLKSTGGIEVWKNVKTLKIQLYQHSSAGRGEVLERYYKRPHFFRQGIQGSNSYITTDGNRVWSVNKGEWKEIEGNPYKRTSSLDDFFIDYKEQGVGYDFVGVEMLNYAPVYHLRRTFWDGYQEDLYFSIQTGYLTEKLTPYNLGPSFFTLWDYGRYGEIWIPRVRMRLVSDLGPPHGAIVKKVEINIPLDDSLFLKKDQ